MIDCERQHNDKSYKFESDIWRGKRPVCPIDKKKCNAETHKFIREHEYSDGVDWGQCRYGPFGEYKDNNTCPPNCVRVNPRTKRWVYDIEGETHAALLRQAGLHNLANIHTNAINPKERHHMERYMYEEEPDELRKKKSSNAKPKRKVTKPVKRCTKRSIKKVVRKIKK